MCMYMCISIVVGYFFQLPKIIKEKSSLSTSTHKHIQLYCTEYILEVARIRNYSRYLVDFLFSWHVLQKR